MTSTSVRVLDDTDLIAIGNTIAQLEGGLNVLKTPFFYEKTKTHLRSQHQRDCRESENADKEIQKLVDLYDRNQKIHISREVCRNIN